MRDSLRIGTVIGLLVWTLFGGGCDDDPSSPSNEVLDCRVAAGGCPAGFGCVEGPDSVHVCQDESSVSSPGSPIPPGGTAMTNEMEIDVEQAGGALGGVPPIFLMPTDSTDTGGVATSNDGAGLDGGSSSASSGMGGQDQGGSDRTEPEPVVIDNDLGACGAADVVDLNAVGPDADEAYVFQGVTAAEDRFRGSCGALRLAGADAVIAFTAPETAQWEFTTLGTSFDTVLYIRRDCLDLGSEIPNGCNDDIDYAAGLAESRITTRLEAGTAVYIIVDTYSGVTAQPFVLSVKPFAPAPPPVLLSAEMALDLEQSLVGIRLTGRSEDTGVVAAFVNFFDDLGRGLFGPGGAGLSQTLNQVTEGPDGRFDGLWVRQFNSDLQVIKSATVSAVAEDGQRSTAIEVPNSAIIEPSLAARGEQCDQVVSICDPTSLCIDGACQAPGIRGQCPADWFVETLILNSSGSVAASGSLLGRQVFTRGSCGGGVANQVYTLTSPIDGAFVVRLEGSGIGADPVLYVRSACSPSNLGLGSVEIACNDDRGLSPDGQQVLEIDANGAPVLSAMVAVELRANEPVYIFVDGFNPTTQNASSGTGRAWRGTYELRVDQAQQPTLTGGRAYLNTAAGAVGVEVLGFDQDVTEVELTLLNNVGEALAVTRGEPVTDIEASIGDDRNLDSRREGAQLESDEMIIVDGEEMSSVTQLRTRLRRVTFDNGLYTGSVSVELPKTMDYRDAVQVRLRTWDVTGLVSDPLTVDLVSPPPGVGANQICDYFLGLNVCTNEGDFCYYPPGNSTVARCNPAAIPSISNVEFFFGADSAANEFSILVEGRDPDMDVSGVLLRFLDVCDRPLFGSVNGLFFELQTLEYIDPSSGRFSGRGDYRFFDAVDTRALSNVEVSVVDSARLQTSWVYLGFSQPEAILSGGACQAIDPTVTCTRGTVCLQQDQAGREALARCERVARDCNPAWPVREIPSDPTQPTGTRWRYSGSTVQQTNKATGSCGGAGPEEVLLFSPGTAGSYTCSIAAESLSGGNPILYARRFCGTTIPASEEACAVPNAAGAGVQVSLSLEAGESRYLFVDGVLSSDALSDYTLVCDVDDSMVTDPSQCPSTEPVRPIGGSLLPDGFDDADPFGPVAGVYASTGAGGALIGGHAGHHGQEQQANGLDTGGNTADPPAGGSGGGPPISGADLGLDADVGGASIGGTAAFSTSSETGPEGGGALEGGLLIGGQDATAGGRAEPQLPRGGASGGAEAASD